MLDLAVEGGERGEGRDFGVAAGADGGYDAGEVTVGGGVEDPAALGVLVDF